MSGAPHWCNERTAKLGALFDNGISAGVAARLLRVSRGAVTGRASRLGWRIGAPRTEEQRQPPFLCVTDNTRAPRPPRPTMNPADAMVRFTCSFDPETFRQIVARTRADGISRCQVVRELVEWGLEAVERENAA